MKGVSHGFGVHFCCSFHSFIQNLTPEHLAKTSHQLGFPQSKSLAVVHENYNTPLEHTPGQFP